MPEISEPHATSHEDGGADPIDASKLDKMLKIIPYNDKIADITEADTATHTLDLATALSETRTIIAVIVSAERVTGTGYCLMYPNEGSTPMGYGIDRRFFGYIVIKDGTNRLQYSLTNANDDFDLYCFGYVVKA